MFLQYFIRVSTSLNDQIYTKLGKKKGKKNLVQSESFIKFIISIIYWKFQRLCLRLSHKGKGTWKL